MITRGITLPINGAKACALCKYWWDPACRYIEPRTAIDWQIDSAARCFCLKRNTMTTALDICAKYRCKIEL